MNEFYDLTEKRVFRDKPDDRVSGKIIPWRNVKENHNPSNTDFRRSMWGNITTGAGNNTTTWIQQDQYYNITSAVTTTLYNDHNILWSSTPIHTPSTSGYGSQIFIQYDGNNFLTPDTFGMLTAYHTEKHDGNSILNLPTIKERFKLINSKYSSYHDVPFVSVNDKNKGFSDINLEYKYQTTRDYLRNIDEEYDDGGIFAFYVIDYWANNCCVPNHERRSREDIQNGVSKNNIPSYRYLRSYPAKQSVPWKATEVLDTREFLDELGDVKMPSDSWWLRD